VNVRAVDAGAGEGRSIAVELQGDDVVHEPDGEPMQAPVDQAKRLAVVSNY
jgi:hypothetical protein